MKYLVDLSENVNPDASSLSLGGPVESATLYLYTCGTMAWYWARTAKMMGVGPAGKKSKTPQLRGRRNAVRMTGGMIDVRSPDTKINDCLVVS